MYIKRPTSVHFKAFKNGEVYVYAADVLYCIRPFLANTTFFINLPFESWYSFSGDGFKILNTTPLINSNIIIDLPPPERSREFGINKITVDNLSNSPARIYTDTGIIVLNPKFFSYPIEQKLFILLHEVGHFYYKTEWKADQYAAHHYLKIGLNPSQAFKSLAGILHETRKDGTPNEINIDRIQRIYNLLAL